MLEHNELFACHKYLEQSAFRIGTRFATTDFRNTAAIAGLLDELATFFSTLQNHGHWEEQFIFAVFLPESIQASTAQEHNELEKCLRDIVHELRLLKKLPLTQRITQGRKLYLRYRKLLATLLLHFCHEESEIYPWLRSTYGDTVIREIDYPIYQEMSGTEIYEMLRNLLPPCNFSEKQSIVKDIRTANPQAFDTAIDAIKSLFSPDELKELLGSPRYATQKTTI